MSFYENHIFPLLLDIANTAFRQDRASLFARASGSVLELGMGNGASIPYYTEKAHEVIGLEPCATMLATARRQAEKNPPNPATQFRFVEGSAEALPFPDHRFDTIIAYLVFCTIPNPAIAAREMYRVLKPGGRLLFFEHVRSPDEKVYRWQKRLNPAWSKIACGCQLIRDSRQFFSEAGFAFDKFERFQHPKVALPLISTIITGEAITETGKPIP